MAKKKDDSSVRAGSNNVFRDLQIADAGEAMAKAEMARHIGDLIEQRSLTQVDAAKLLGVDQPKISALLRGRLSGFSTDRLLRFLTALDRDIEIAIRPKARSRARGRIRVVKQSARQG